MRRVRIDIGGKPVGEYPTWAYPNGQTLGVYLVPVYACTVSGTDAAGKAVKENFQVLRFGVKCTDGKTARSVGLAAQQTHTIKAWISTYKVHSAASEEMGAWQVYGNFLVHDGPDSPRDLFATVGCVELVGPRAFSKFNDLIVALSGSTKNTRAQQLAEIGNSGLLSITYAAATRPPVKKQTY